MATGTQTGTTTQTIATQDVRSVLRSIGRDITYLCDAAAQAAPDFDRDNALIDCSVLALNDVISAIRLQFYLADELVREYSYVVAPVDTLDADASAEHPPLGTIPRGARVRLVVSHNRTLPEEERNAWFQRLGWKAAQVLKMPAAARSQHLGAIVSGGYGVERQLLINPKYDRPVQNEADADLIMGKAR